jgi:hypothetical protein
MNGTQSAFSFNCTGGIESFPVPDQPFVYSTPVSGSGNTIRATQEFRDSGSIEGISWTSVATVTFNGTISGNTVTGALTWNSTADVRGPGGTTRGVWTGTINVTLR